MKRTFWSDPEKIFGVICVCILTVVMVANVRKSLIHEFRRSGGENAAKTTVKRPKIDWSALYPFPNDTKDRASENRDSHAIKTRIGAIKKDVTKVVSDDLIGRRTMVGLSKMYKRSVFWNYAPYSEYNNVVYTSNGSLTSLVPWRDIEGIGSKTVAFNEFCKKRSIPMIYVNAPSKNCLREEAELRGIDFCRLNGERFCDFLTNNGVENIDLTDFIHDDGRPCHEKYYRTDHHWRFETGLWAARVIATYLKTNFGIGEDSSLLDDDQFTKEVFPHCYIGSRGKKLTTVNVSPEDFTLLHPKYPTDISYQSPELNLDKRGAFEVMYDMNHMTEPRPFSRYSTILAGERPLNRIVNERADDSSRILVIHDSYGRSVVPFLALIFHEILSVDIREFNGSIQNFIEKERPDIVVIIYTSGVLKKDSPKEFVFR